jgi:hypothetical protein
MYMKSYEYGIYSERRYRMRRGEMFYLITIRMEFKKNVSI